MNLLFNLFVLTVSASSLWGIDELRNERLSEEVDFINYADRVIRINLSFEMSSSDALFGEGYYYYKLEDYENALRKFEDYLLVSTNPELRDYALFMAGLSAMNLEDYARASRYFDSIMYLVYLEDYKSYFLAYSYYKSGDYGRAKMAIDHLLAMYPRTILSVDAEFLRLDILISQERYSDFIAYANLILQNNSRFDYDSNIDEWLYFTLAKAYLKLGDKERTKESLLRIYADYPISVFAPKAYDILTKDLKITPDIQMRLKRAENLFKRQMFQNSLEEYRRIEGLVKDREDKRSLEIRKRIKVKMADCYASLRENSIARELYSELLNDSYYTPDMKAYFLYMIAQLAKRKTDNSEAIRLYNELAEKYPKSKYADEARYLAIWLKYNDGNYDEAIEGFKRFVNQYKRSQRRRDALWFLGINLLKKKMYDEAYRYFYEIKRTTPNTEKEKPASIYFLGRISGLLGRLEESRAHYINLIENFPLNYYSLMAQNRLKELFNEDVPFPDFEGRFDLESDYLSISDEPEKFVLAQEAFLRLNKVIQLIKVGLERYAQRELSYINLNLKNDYRALFVLSSLNLRAGDYYNSMRVIRQFFIENMLNRPSSKEMKFWKRMFPLAYLEYVIQNAERYDLDPLLILAIMREESHFRPNVISPAGAKGLMQIMPKTGKLISKSLEFVDFDDYMLDIPEINIQLGSWYLSQLMVKFNYQLPFVVASYNAGPAAVDRWLKRGDKSDLDIFIEEIPYKETRGYVKRVLQTYGIYNFLYRKKDGKNVLPLNQDYNPTSKDNINF